MSGRHNLIECPCCGESIERSSTRCHHCGYRSLLENARELLEGLTVLSSILIGLSIAGLMELREALTADPHPFALELTGGCWFAGSACLSVILVWAEYLRRGEWVEIPLLQNSPQLEHVLKQCDFLRKTFYFSASVIGLGMICLPFSVTSLHGFTGVGIVALVLTGGYWKWRGFRRQQRSG